MSYLLLFTSSAKINLLMTHLCRKFQGCNIASQSSEKLLKFLIGFSIVGNRTGGSMYNASLTQVELSSK